MQKRILLAAVMLAHAYAQTTASSVIRKAADALGGADRIKSLHSLRLEGYGQEAVQNGGGNTSASREAPQRWTNALNWEETIDLANQRIRIRQRAQAWLPAATMSRVIGNITTTAILDGDVAYNVNQQGAARRTTARNLRTELQTHPVALLRLALDPSTAVTNPRTEGKAQLVDIAPKQGPRYTLAIDAKTGLPLWVRWTENEETLRDLTHQKWFTGFEPINGIMMPTGFKTIIDFRNVVDSQI